MGFAALESQRGVGVDLRKNIGKSFELVDLLRLTHPLKADPDIHIVFRSV
jgi:hypothetical protein